MAISDPEARKQIYTIFNTLTTEDFASIDPVDVAKTCRLLILSYMKERFDISLDLFKKFPETFAGDEGLLISMLENIPVHSMRKYEQFMGLSQSIKDPTSEMAKCWNGVFSRLFLNMNSSLDIHTLEALEKILENPSLLNLVNADNRNRAVSKILTANPRSPRFAKCLSDAFVFVQKGVDENTVVEFCKKLSFSKDAKLIENTFTSVTKFSFASENNRKECWLCLMEALLKVRSNKFKEIVANYQKPFLAIFNPNEENNSKAYELLLKGVSYVLRKKFAASTFDDLIKIVHQYKPFKDEKELLNLNESILLPYAECLSMSANVKTKNRGGFLLKKMIERKFFYERGKMGSLYQEHEDHHRKIGLAIDGKYMRPFSAACRLSSSGIEFAFSSKIVRDQSGRTPSFNREASEQLPVRLFDGPIHD